MWYKISSDKDKLKNNNQSSFNKNEDWFESVPENFWKHNSLNLTISKSIEIKNNIPANSFIVKEKSKELGEFSDIDLAKKFVKKKFNA